MLQLKQSTAFTLVFFMTDSNSHYDGKLDLVDADFTDIQISKNGGAFTSIESAVTVEEIGLGYYKFTLTTSHTDTVGELAFYIYGGTTADELCFIAQVQATSSGSDPWDVALPGSYTSGKAGYILGTNVDAKSSDIKAKTDLMPSTWPTFPSNVADQITVNQTLSTSKKVVSDGASEASVASRASNTDMKTVLATLQTILARLEAM